MLSCIIVPGCTSGYGSNLDRVHFFMIPKAPGSENIWKAGIRRVDSTVKSGKLIYIHLPIKFRFPRFPLIRVPSG